MDLKSKIFSLIIILLLFTVQVQAVKILKPGDVVKGKRLQERYYCYSLEEQLALNKKLELGKEFRKLAETLNEQVVKLIEKNTELKIQNKQFEEKARQYNITVNLSKKREEYIQNLLEVEQRKFKRQRGRTKGAFGTGFLAGFLTVILSANAAR